MIPWYKIASLMIRTFSKPFVNHAKKIAVVHHNDSMRVKHSRNALMWLGNKYRVAEIQINKLLSGQPLKTDIHLKPIRDEQAVEKGAECLSEIFLYTILIGLPTYEIMRQMRDNERKSQAQNDRIQSIQEVLDKNLEQTQQLSTVYKKTLMELQSKNEELISAALNVEKQFQEQITVMRGQLVGFQDLLEKNLEGIND